MAQVEFVSVIREILSKWRIEAVARAGESGEDARQRLRHVVQESQPKVSLQVRKPADVVLRFIQR